ncbi:hypothetical protein BWZ20_00305 [Winogradskyella sp. J14-2]|nr:hypothetical protein BWZ20_00305 [Winogradskyella sp. J14-2]
MNKKKFKIIRLYLIGLVCVVSYYFLDNSNVIPNLVERMSDFRYSGFPTFFLTGLLKYGLLIVGIGIIIILTFLLIKERTKKIIE